MKYVVKMEGVHNSSKQRLTLQEGSILTFQVYIGILAVTC